MRKNKLIAAAVATTLALGGISTPFVSNSITALAETVTQTSPQDPSTVRDLPVAYMDSISSVYLGNAMVENVYQDYAATYEKQLGTFGYVYKFTLDKPCYVNICALVKVFSFNFVGSYELYLGSSPDVTNCKLDSKFADGDKQTNYITALEAGTYYLKLQITHEGNASSRANFLTDATASINVAAQPMTGRTGNVLGDSMKTAIPTSRNTVAHGAITGIGKSTIDFSNTPQQYFKVTLPQASKLKLSVITTQCCDVYASSQTKMEVLDSYGKLLKTYTSAYGTNSIDATTDKLAKGTYYLKVTYPAYCEFALKANYSATPAKKTISSIKVTAKKNKKSITVKTLKSASVKIKLGKKTYKGKTNKKGSAVIKTAKLKKGTSFKVTVSKSGYKTKTKSFKVK